MQTLSGGRGVREQENEPQTETVLTAFLRKVDTVALGDPLDCDALVEDGGQRGLHDEDEEWELTMVNAVVDEGDG